MDLDENTIGRFVGLMERMEKIVDGAVKMEQRLVRLGWVMVAAFLVMEIAVGVLLVVFWDKGSGGEEGRSIEQDVRHTVHIGKDGKRKLRYPGFYTETEFADLIGVHEDTIERRRVKGLKPYDSGVFEQGRWLYPKEIVDEVVE